MVYRHLYRSPPRTRSLARPTMFDNTLTTRVPAGAVVARSVRHRLSRGLPNRKSAKLLTNSLPPLRRLEIRDFADQLHDTQPCAAGFAQPTPQQTEQPWPQDQTNPRNSHATRNTSCCSPTDFIGLTSCPDTQSNTHLCGSNQLPATRIIASPT